MLHVAFGDRAAFLLFTTDAGQDTDFALNDMQHEI
jgi:hypothetical protein